MIHYVSTDLLNIAYRKDGSPDDPVGVLLPGWPDTVKTTKTLSLPVLYIQGEVDRVNSLSDAVSLVNDGNGYLTVLDASNSHNGDFRLRK